MFRYIAVGHKPWDSRHPELLWVQDKMRKMAPESDAHYNIRLEPAIVPFLL